MEKFPNTIDTTEHISNVENQELYSKIEEEINSIEILDINRDQEGNLLAPNGEKSNLEVHEWKLVRTPSFLKKFGNWIEKYNKDRYELWMKFQEMKTCEEDIQEYRERVEHNRNNLIQVEEKSKQTYLDGMALYQERIIKLSHTISSLHAELINNDFNTHSEEFDYTKVLDENGEPLLVCRGTAYGPGEDGKFVSPKNVVNGQEFNVGLFFGKEDEAKFHHSARESEGKKAHLYSAFINGRNFKILDSKPDWWSKGSGVETLKNTYDGIWVKNNRSKSTHTKDGVSMLEYVCFDPDDIYIVKED